MVVWWCAFCCCRKEDPRETKIMNWDSPRKKVNKEDPHQHHHSQPGLIRTDQTETREDHKETRCCLQSGDDRLSLRFWAAVEPTQRQEFQCYFISRFNIWIGHLICGDRRGRVTLHDIRTNNGIDPPLIMSISSDGIMFFTVKSGSLKVSSFAEFLQLSPDNCPTLPNGNECKTMDKTKCNHIWSSQRLLWQQQKAITTPPFST